MSQDEFTRNDQQQDTAQLLADISQRLLVLEEKDNVTAQRFDRLEQQVVQMTQNMTASVDQLVQLVNRIQLVQSQETPEQAAQPSQAAQPGQAEQLVPSVQPIAAPVPPDPIAIAAASQTAAANRCSGGCGGGSSTDELMDLAVDAAKIVGVTAAIGIGGYAAFKGGQWLIGQISNWTK